MRDIYLAEKTEAENKGMRDAAFCSTPYEVAGVPIRVMTLQDLVDLTVAKSPLITGEITRGIDVVNFMWALSPDNDGTDSGREQFTADLPDLNFCYLELLEYLRFIFLDAPRGSGEGDKTAVSHVACAIDFFATEYDWSDHKTLSTAIPQIFQLQRAAALRRGGKPSAAVVNRAKAAYLQAMNETPERHRERWARDQSRALEKERKRGRI